MPADTTAPSTATETPHRPLTLRTIDEPNRSAVDSPFPFPRLFRAHIEADSHKTERTVFVEAASHRDAVRKIANAVAAVDCCLPEALEALIYNVTSARELIQEGLSEDLALRLFETGWCGDRATHFVEEPLFLIAAPAALMRRWARIPAEVSDAG